MKFSDIPNRIQCAHLRVQRRKPPEKFAYAIWDAAFTIFAFGAIFYALFAFPSCTAGPRGCHAKSARGAFPNAALSR